MNKNSEEYSILEKGSKKIDAREPSTCFFFVIFYLVILMLFLAGTKLFAKHHEMQSVPNLLNLRTLEKKRKKR